MTQFIDFEFIIATSPESWPFYIGSYVLFKYLLSPTDVCTYVLKVSLLGVDSLWGDCTFIPVDWGS